MLSCLITGAVLSVAEEAGRVCDCRGGCCCCWGGGGGGAGTERRTALGPFLFELLFLLFDAPVSCRKRSLARSSLGVCCGRRVGGERDSNNDSSDELLERVL